jgi:xanthine dehydrogenase molybdopterin-binding subunit B
VKRHAQECASVFLFCAAVVAALAAAVYFARSYRHDGLLCGGNISDFTSGWKTGAGENASLPGVVGTGADGAVTLTRRLPAALLKDSVICLNTSYQSLSVSVGGRQIYAWNSQGKTVFVRPFGLSCYLISLPASADRAASDASRSRRISLARA